MKKVLIKIRGTQTSGGKSDVIELSTEGVMRNADGDFVLLYDEGELLGGRKVKTRLTARGDNTVILERSGDLSSKIVIEKGVRNSCFYCIPEGELTLGIYGKSVENKLSESGGSVKMVYSIDADLRPISENSVEISVNEVK